MEEIVPAVWPSSGLTAAVRVVTVVEVEGTVGTVEDRVQQVQQVDAGCQAASAKLPDGACLRAAENCQY